MSLATVVSAWSQNRRRRFGLCSWIWSYRMWRQPSSSVPSKSTKALILARSIGPRLIIETLHSRCLLCHDGNKLRIGRGYFRPLVMSAADISYLCPLPQFFASAPLCIAHRSSVRSGYFLRVHVHEFTRSRWCLQEVNDRNVY